MKNNKMNFSVRFCLSMITISFLASVLCVQRAHSYPICVINVGNCISAKSTIVSTSSGIVDLKSPGPGSLIHQSAEACFAAGQEFANKNSCSSPILADFSYSDIESEQAFLLPAVVSVNTLVVSSLTGDATGFHVRFNRNLNAKTLNLYNNQTNLLGVADVSLSNSTSGNIPGSVVLDRDHRGFRFVARGGLLQPTTYTVKLVSATNGVVGLDGALLDGNRDGVAGDSFTGTFIVANEATPVLAIKKFMRGPGQSVDLLVSNPATGSMNLGGLPLGLNLMGIAGVRKLSFDLEYDGSLLSITGAIAGSELPAGATVAMSGADGLRRFEITSSVNLPNISSHLVKIVAHVPASASIGQSQILRVSNVKINGATVSFRADPSVHLVGYFGDTDRSWSYTNADVTLLQRVSVGQDSGFVAYPLIDPILVGDINGSGSFSAIDATRLLQEVNFVNGLASTDRPEIPPVPSP